MNNTARKTILLVEDEVLIAEAEAMTLRDHGYTVLTAHRGTKAVEAALGDPSIDLILMDIDLGRGMSGPEAAERILEQKELPVVFLSSHTEPEIVEKTERITSYGYVVKNSGITVLNASIKMAFRLFDEKRKVKENRQELAAAYEELEATNEELMATNELLEESQDELRERESALRESERLMKEIAANYPNSYISIIEHDMTVGFSSGQEFKKQGLDPGRFTGLSLEEVFGGHTPFVRDKYLKAFGGEESEFELFINNQHQLYRVVPLADANGGIERILSVVENITERKRAEERITLLAHMVDVAPNSILVHDFEGAMIYANRKTFEMHGFDEREFMAMNLHDIDVPESEKLIAPRMRRIEEKGEAAFDVWHRRKDGSIFPMHIYVKKILWGDQPAMLSIGTDITESRRDGDALRESEERFRFLAENMGDIIWTLDPDLNTTYVSPSVRKVLGFSPEERKRLPLDQIMTPESLERTATLLAEEMKKEKERTGDPDRTVTIEVEYYHAGGGTVWMENSIKAMRGRDGEFIGIYGSSRDITERRRAEEEIRTQKERLENIIEGTGAGTWEWNVRTGETRFNEKWAEMIGYTLEELSPVSVETWGRFADPDDLSAVGGALEKHFNGESEFYTAEYRFKHKDGRWIWVLDRGKVISRTQDGAPLWILGTHLDITRQKNAEEALRDAEYKYRAMVDHSQSIIYTIGADGMFTFVSPSWKTLLGHEPEEIVGSNFAPLMHEDDVPHCTEFLRKTAETGTIQPGVEYRVFHKDGSVRWHRSVITPFYDEQKNLTLFVGNAVDLTYRKLAEEALKASEANFRRFFETVDDMFLIGTPEGEILYANPAVSSKLGYSPGELTAMHMLDLHPPKHRAEAEDIYRAMFAGERSACPLPVRRKDGRAVPVDTRVWFGAWDGRDCVFGICKDLSAEQEALQKFQKLFENNPALMAISNVSDRRFIDVNRAFINALGYSKDEIIGKTGDDLGIFIDSVKQSDIAKQLAETKRLEGIEIPVRAKDGAIKIGLFSGETIESQGKHLFLTVMTDITGQKMAQDAIKALLNEKDLLLHEVHHRIKNNMITISSLLSLQGRTLNDERAVSALDEARGRIQSMMIIYDKLFLSADFRAVSAAGYFDELIVGIVSTFPAARRVTVRKNIEDRTLDSKTLFPLGIIVNELMSNAYKYAFPDGREGRIDISFTTLEDGSIELAFQDDGVGMPRSAGDKPKGFGLELVDMLSKQIGGKLEIEGGKVTRFSITFKIKETR